MKKKITCILLALLMVVGMLPVSVMAEDFVPEPPECDMGCNTDLVRNHQQNCAVKEYYREIYRTYSAAELYAMRDVIGQNAWEFIVSESWNLDGAKAQELKTLIENGAITEPTDPTDPEDLCGCCEDCTNADDCQCGCEDCTFCEPGVPTDPTDPVGPSEPTDPSEPEDSCGCCENCTNADDCQCGCEDCTFCEPEVPTDPTDPVDPSEPTDPSEPEDSCGCCESCTDAEGCTCGCEDCTFCEPEVPTDPTDPSVPDGEVSGVVNGQTIVASGCLGDNAELIAEPGDPEKNAYLNQDLRSDLNVYAYNIDLIGEFTGSVELSIAGIPVAGSNELIEVLHLLDSAEAIDAAKEKGTAQGYALPGLEDIFPEEVAASGEADTIYYEVLSASRDAAGNVVFTTNSFSEFIIYTVDFHYKGINFSIPGGTGILLSELLQRLEINKSAASATNVTFSNYELVSVARENGDWRLTSLQPFTSTELLVLTFSDGEVYEINVTDEQRAAANDFLIQISDQYWFQADLSTNANKQIYHPDYEHNDYVYVSPGKTFEVWRDTVWGIGVGVQLVDTNIWWRWNKDPKTITATVHKGTVPDGSESRENWLGNTFYYSYGGNNMNDDLRKATVTVSPNAAKGDYYILTVCNGDMLNLQVGRDYNYARTGDPNRVYIRVAEQIQVTYNLNTDGKGGGGIHGTQTGYSTGTTSTSMKLNRMDAPTAPDGYTFGGWNTKADGTGTPYTAGSTFQPTSNTTYYAKWVPIPYKVKFNGNGATSGSMTDQSFVFDEEKTLSANQFKREYTVTYNANSGSVNPTSETAAATFNGWEDRGTIIHSGVEYPYTVFDAPFYSNPNKSNDVFVSGYANNHYHKYGLLTHYIEHGKGEYNNGYGSPDRKPAPTGNEKPGLYPNGATVSHLTTTKDYTVPLYANWTLGSVNLPTPTRAGYKFEGWYSDSALTNAVGGAGASYTPTANTTLYAKWSTKSYTITYDTAGGTLGTGGTTSYKVTDAITIPTATYTGYEFKGWKVTTVETEGNWTKDSSVSAGSIAAGKYGNVTLTAQWERIAGIASYTVRIHKQNVAQSGYTTTEITPKPSGKVGDTVSVDPNHYAETGFTFNVGKSNSSGVILEKDALVLNLYYDRNTHTVTYATGAGNDAVTGMPSGGTYAYGAEVTVSTAEPTRAGYRFTGWTYSPSVTVANGKFTMPDSAVTITAQWAPISYTITYEYNDGAGNKSTDSYDIEDAVTLAAAPQRTGYNFKGWKLENVNGSNWSAGTYSASQSIGTGKYGNVTMVAQWERQTGSLKLDHEGTNPAIVTVVGEGLNITLVLDKDTTISDLPTGTYTVTASGAAASTTATVDNASPTITADVDTTVKITVSSRNTSWFTGFSREINTCGS